MELTLQREKDERPATPAVVAETPGHCSPQRQGEAGTSTGVNISPGHDDDGWIVPQPVRLSDGTRVQLYKDGEALHAAYDAIQSARRRVCLEVYIFHDDETGTAFAELLTQRAKDGLDVYVLYDGFGSMASNRLMFDRMRAAGAHVAEFHPIRPWETKFGWRPFNRDHRKLLVIDDDIAGLGGLNVGAEYAGSWVINSAKPECELWRDNAVGIRGPGARLFLESFKRTWNYVQHGGRIRRAEFQQGLDEGDLGCMASVPTISSCLCPWLRRLIRRAQQSVYLTMAYFVPDDPLIKELCDAARRGVRVRLMLPGRTDVKIMRMASHAFYEKLMVSGVEIYERQAVVLHAKTIVIDGCCSVIGSTNLDTRSIEFNLEISSIIRNPLFGRQMQDLFENDVRYARRIDLATWRRRPWRDRFVQWGVSRARYLM